MLKHPEIFSGYVPAVDTVNAKKRHFT